MKKLIFIINLFFTIACNGQVPSIGAFQIPKLVSQSSEEPQYQTALTTNSVLVSNDGGITFTETILVNLGPLSEVSMNGSGQYQSAILGANFYFSTNYGQTWSLIYDGIATSGKKSTSISQSGQYIFASGSYSGDRVASTDYGQTWFTPPKVSTGYYYDFSFATGSNSIALAGTNQYGRYSTDMFVNERITYLNGDYSSVYGISASGDGQYVLIPTYNSTIYLSTDYGSSFTSLGIEGDFTAISQSGQYQFLGADDEIYVSNNYGSTFTKTLTLSSNIVHTPEITLDGKFIYISVGSSTIYWSNDYGQTWSEKVFSKDIYGYEINSNHQ